MEVSLPRVTSTSQTRCQQVPVWKVLVQTTNPKYEPILQSFSLNLQRCLEQRMQQGFAVRATALQQKEQQGTVGPNWEQRVSKCWFFPYKVTP